MVGHSCFCNGSRTGGNNCNETGNSELSMVAWRSKQSNPLLIMGYGMRLCAVKRMDDDRRGQRMVVSEG